VLTENWHHFGESSGYTGVVVLAESHLSIHTWPEVGYAAIDVFMCGNCDPRDALPGVLEYFKPDRHEVVYMTRGKDDADGSFYTG
jgi:S-adenosylmethionine decarboxylase